MEVRKDGLIVMEVKGRRVTTRVMMGGMKRIGLPSCEGDLRRINIFQREVDGGGCCCSF